MPKTKITKRETTADRLARRGRWQDAQICWRDFAQKFLVERRSFLFERDGKGKVYDRKAFNKSAVGGAIGLYSSLKGINREKEFALRAKAAYKRARNSEKLVFAHALFAYKLIVLAKKTANKKDFVNCLALGDFGDNLYWGGVARTGQSYIKCGESVAYILNLFNKLVSDGKNLKSVNSVNKAIRAHCEKGYNKKSAAAKWAANALLWYAASKEYEPILAQTDKSAIANCPAFVKLIKDNPGYLPDMAKDEFKRNKVIHLIRKAYAKKAGREWFSFYDSDVKRIWRD